MSGERQSNWEVWPLHCDKCGEKLPIGFDGYDGVDVSEPCPKCYWWLYALQVVIGIPIGIFVVFGTLISVGYIWGICWLHLWRRTYAWIASTPLAEGTIEIWRSLFGIGLPIAFVVFIIVCSIDAARCDERLKRKQISEDA